MAKTLTTTEIKADWDTAEIMSYTVNLTKKTIEVKICKRAAAETTPGIVLQWVIRDTDYDALMDAMGDAAKDLKTQLEDALWTELEAKSVIDVV